MKAVPASRADVFRDKTLGLSDKRFLMRFFKLVSEYTESEGGVIEALAPGDLDKPFVELLRRQQLPTSIQEYDYTLSCPLCNYFSSTVSIDTVLEVVKSDWSEVCSSNFRNYTANSGLSMFEHHSHMLRISIVSNQCQY